MRYSLGDGVNVTMRTEDLPEPDRFEWWCERVGRDITPTAISSPRTADFRATATLADLGPVGLEIHSLPELRVVRTSALIRRSDPERYGLSLITADSLWLAQRDHQSRIQAGDLLLHDTSQPYEARIPSGAGSRTMVMLHFPKAALPLRPQRLNHVLGRGLSSAAGMNTVLARYIGSVASAVTRGDLGQPETARLGGIALDLAAATLATHLDTISELTPETRRQALLAQIEAFVEHNLGDPELTPAGIAAHHHISIGYLHRLFQPRELTVTAWIRHHRLERCQADLADPRLRQHPVHVIGARWGFRDPAHFNRSFRAAYGLTPGEYRRQNADSDPRD